MTRLEDVNVENVKKLENSELKNMRERANQLYKTSRQWQTALQERTIGVNQPIPRDSLMEAYHIISEELRDRGSTLKNSEIDSKLLRRKLRGIDVSEMPPIIVKHDVVTISGDYVTSPRTAKIVDIRIDADEFGDDGFTHDLEKRMVELILEMTGRNVVSKRDAEGLVGPVISMYDLVLIPATETVTKKDISDLIKRLSKKKVDVDWTVDEGTTETLGTLDDRITCIEGEGQWTEEKRELNKPDISVNYTDIQKPFPSEHAARQLPPSQFDSFTRTNNKFGSGIHAVFGIKSGKAKLQSIRVSADKFTTKQAKAWLKSHDYKTALEVATKKSKGTGFVKNAEARIVGGIVYAPNQVDSDGDFVGNHEEIFKGMKGWMLSGHNMHMMHKGQAVHTPLVECFQADVDTMKSGTEIPAGAWYISNYIPTECEDLWDAIKSGEITGYSMAGSADMEDIE